MTQPPAGPEAAVVTDVPEKHRFEIAVDGEPAGFTEYVDGTGDDTGVRTFPHTVIEDAYRGHGLAALLIRTALDATRVADLAVDPQCSAVRGFIEKNSEYLDLVPASRRAEHGL